MIEQTEALHLFSQLKNSLKAKGVIDSDLPFFLINEESDTAFLLLHGSLATPCNTISLAKELQQKGFSVMGGLLSGHGFFPDYPAQSNVSWRDCYFSALDYLNLLKPFARKIYIIGSSFGGTLAYLLGINYPDSLSGVVAISAPTYIKHFPDSENAWSRQVFDSIATLQKNISQFSLPLLILHGSDDLVVQVNQAFFAHAQVSSLQKKMIIYDQIGHSLGFGANTAEVAQDIASFIDFYPDPHSVTFKLYAPEAFSVSLAGDFNNWKQNEFFLENNGQGSWQISILLKPGNYQYKFVINENNWILDPQGEKVLTPHGQENSFLRVI